MPKTSRTLDLGALCNGQSPGMTPKHGAFAAEAASVLLEHNKHKSGVIMSVKTPRARRYALLWPPLDVDAGRSHNDLPATVEHAAYGVAALLVEELTSYKLLERAWKGGGFDYWLTDDDFRRAARLEVSGIVNDPSSIASRVKRKEEQVRKSYSGREAYIAVVEFGQPIAVFKQAS